MDDPQGHVSIINLASLRDLAARLGRPVDPRRVSAPTSMSRAGRPGWRTMWSAARVSLGDARGEVVKPIARCIATHVDPDTGERDLDVVKGLHDAYGSVNCGVYIRVTEGGRVQLGEPARLER